MAVGQPLPPDVVDLVGPDAAERTGEGASRVFAGNGLVAKVGPPALIARERWVLEQPHLPVEVAEVVAAGDGWLVTVDVPDAGAPWGDDDLHAALAGLAALHDAFEDGLPPDASERLRRPVAEVGALLAGARRARFPLPPILGHLLTDPGPLVDVLDREPPTLTHGDPWPANLRRPAAGRLVWIDWEQASVAPAAGDVATWLDQTPWHLGRPIDTSGHVDAYLAARRRGVDRAHFARAVDAAGVLWFFAFDVPRIAAGAPPELAAAIVGARAAAAERALA